MGSIRGNIQDIFSLIDYEAIEHEYGHQDDDPTANRRRTGNWIIEQWDRHFKPNSGVRPTRSDASRRCRMFQDQQWNRRHVKPNSQVRLVLSSTELSTQNITASVLPALRMASLLCSQYMPLLDTKPSSSFYAAGYEIYQSFCVLVVSIILATLKQC